MSVSVLAMRINIRRYYLIDFVCIGLKEMPCDLEAKAQLT